MFSTIELRWFYPGELPSEIHQWFTELDPLPKDPDRRADIYLQPVTTDVGVKLRQGNLELKYRQSDLGSLQIGDYPIGKVELWSKWLCTDSTPDRLTPARIADRDGWLKVEKVRYQRLYRVAFDDRGCHLTPIPTPEDGAAAIEVTQLKLVERVSWTIACEYLGDNLPLDREFKLLVAALLNTCPLPSVGTPISCGYPEWLLTDNW
jgi:hypothetical protein